MGRFRSRFNSYFGRKPWRGAGPDQPRIPKITALPVQPVELPAVGASVDLGTYGMCTVLSITSELCGLRMIEFRCDRGGRSTTPGDVFKMSDQAVICELTNVAQRTADNQYFRFCGAVKNDIAQLGLVAWKPFLDWLRAVDIAALPPSKNTDAAQGRLGELYRLHERTIAGFLAQWLSDERPAFSIVIHNGKISVADTVPETEIRASAQAIGGASTDNATWAKYRRLVAEEVVFLVGATRRIISFIIARQKQWIRTRDVADLKRLTFSDEALCATAQCASPTVRALLSNIGSITFGNQELDIRELFTGMDFENNRITAALVLALEASGCASLERLTIAARNTLRQAAGDALNKDMPPYLRRPLTEVRFRKCLTAAAARVKFPEKDRPAASHAWREEKEQLLTITRDHQWNINAAAATLHVSPLFLREHLEQHNLMEQLRSERDACVLEAYNKAAPNAFRTRTLVYRGIKAVADAFALDISDGENLTPMGRAERLIKQAFLRVDARRQFADRVVSAAINRHYGDRTNAARDLGIRIAHLHQLLDVFELWHLVWIRGKDGLVRGDVWRQQHRPGKR